LQLAGKPARLSTQSFAELAREQAQLLFQQVGQMAKIEAEHSKSGEFVSCLISVKANPAEKPAGTGQKEIVEVKPGAFGITVNMKEIAKRIWKCVCSRSKD